MFVVTNAGLVEQTGTLEITPSKIESTTPVIKYEVILISSNKQIYGTTQTRNMKNDTNR